MADGLQLGLKKYVRLMFKDKILMSDLQHIPPPVMQTLLGSVFQALVERKVVGNVLIPI
jgi:hypothetical protein